MTLSRRILLGGAASSALIVPFSAFAAQNGSATREFSASRGSSKAGSQKITLTRSGDIVTIDLQTRLKVRLLGIPVYRYNLNSRETWEGGVLQRISGKTDDNGKNAYVEARRTGAGLEVNGSDYKGVVKGNVASTSFFTTSLLDRKVWVSTQGGKPIKVAVAKKGRATLGLPTGNVACTHYYFGGELKIPIDAYFDGNGGLAGYMFDAKGERARVLATSMTPDLNSIWA